MNTIDKGDTIEFTLHLDDIRQLFDAPEVDPFTQQTRVTSGIDEVADRLRTKRLRRRPRLSATLVLPAERIGADLEVQTREAISRYCDIKIAEARREKEIARFEGRSKLGAGLLTLPIVALAIALIFVVTPTLPQPLVLFLTPIFTVIIWVAIWNPVEVLLYDRWDENRTIEIFNCIKSMDLRILAAEEFQAKK